MATDQGPVVQSALLRTELTRLRKELAKAVEGEDYERAAKLRDQIKEAETDPSATEGA